MHLTDNGWADMSKVTQDLCFCHTNDFVEMMQNKPRTHHACSQNGQQKQHSKNSKIPHPNLLLHKLQCDLTDVTNRHFMTCALRRAKSVRSIILPPALVCAMAVVEMP